MECRFEQAENINRQTAKIAGNTVEQGELYRVPGNNWGGEWRYGLREKTYGGCSVLDLDYVL